MKALKFFGIALGVLIAVFLIGALFLPAEYAAKSEILIKAPVDSVYDFAIDVNNREAWSPWRERDPNAEISFQGEGNRVGDGYSWKGEEMGVGSMTITKLEHNEVLESTLAFKEPFESELAERIEFDGADGNTTVTWIGSGPLPYPTMRWMGLFIPGQIESDFKFGLQKLKKEMEQ